MLGGFCLSQGVRPGDMVYIYTATCRTGWVVRTVLVCNNELDFVAPTHDLRLTMYTCKGGFDWRTRPYSHFRVITALLVDAFPA